MTHVLVVLHRWLGVAFCLPIALWFASGIVMHFVPFPWLSEVDRFAGSAPLDLTRVEHGQAEAVEAGASSGATRVRLIQHGDGPVYLISDRSAVKAVRATDLADGSIRSPQSALSIATDYARRRHLDFPHAAVAAVASYDQWTMSRAYDPHRPLYRIALGDDAGTELYLSSTTGEVALATTRRGRAWNYVGSITHWIYFTALRGHADAWNALLWCLSFLALIAAGAGAMIGTLQIENEGGRLVSPLRGWHAWHHWLGLICTPFILAWLFSGWLSLDDGRLFSSGKPTAAETAALFGAPTWDRLPPDEMRRLPAGLREVEWFAFGGRIYRRERESLDRQRLVAADSAGGLETTARAFLHADEIDAAARHLARACERALLVASDDNYAAPPAMRNAPVFRVVCRGEWLQIDGSDGALFEKLDGSRRRYRWLFGRLHRLDFPFLAARPTLRTVLIVVLCACGLIFSLTATVIAWRRVLSSFRPTTAHDFRATAG